MKSIVTSEKAAADLITAPILGFCSLSNITILDMFFTNMFAIFFMFYAQISSAQESPSSVEAWVVRAISEGVIDGRIDQLNRKVWGLKQRCNVGG